MKWNEWKELAVCERRRESEWRVFVVGNGESDKPTNAFNFCKCCTLFGAPNSSRTLLSLSPLPALCTVTTRHSHTSLCEATPYMRLLLFANGLTQCPSCPLAPLQSPGREASVRQCVRRELFVCLSVWANYNWVQWERIELRRVLSISHASAVNDEL